ncbi:MAG: DUF349 domain-containing protein, partial [Bacteroidetes bacterium]
MLMPEHETPEVRKDIEDVAEVNPAEVVVENEDTVVGEEPSVGEAETLPLTEPQAETQGEDPVVQSEEVAEAAPEEVAAGEEQEQEEVAPSELDGLPELNLGLLDKIEDIMQLEDPGKVVLEEANIADLIHLLDRYIHSDDVRGSIPRVGLVKRSYDFLKSNESIPDEFETIFQAAFSRFNKKRTEFQKQAEILREENSRLKRELIDRLQTVLEANDPSRIKEVREIQDAWKHIGQVLKVDIEPLYNKYRSLLDQFYKLREMHLEMLEYDRKINLQEKERMIQEIFKLIPPEEQRGDVDLWRERMDQLSEIQLQWKTVGHIPREEMERVNEEYRSAVDRFFEARQGFNAILEQQRQENAEKKQGLLDEMSAFANFEAEKPREWNDATQKLRDIQEAWKATGPAPSNVNGELWHKYREITNNFFAAKSKFFADFDEVRTKNLERKRELVEKAEELVKDVKDKDWDRVGKDLRKLQDEWKLVGAVPERHSNKLWARFREACDSFFGSRRQHYKGGHQEEFTNLDAKKALIDEV